jgi:hypothetical protein
MKTNRLFVTMLCVLVLLWALVGIFVPITHKAPAPPKPAPACKVCHCGQSACHRDCSAEGMCLVRCEGLCKHKDKLATPSDLVMWFKWDNEQYFRSKLPADTEVIWAPELDTLDVMGRTDKVNGRFRIRLSPKFNAGFPTMRLTLLHEACHVETWTEDLEHGLAWHKCVARLISNRAIEDLI